MNATDTSPQQDDTYHEAIYRFVSVMLRAYIANPGMKFAVFIHKAEMLSEDYRGGETLLYYHCESSSADTFPENYAEIQRAVQEELEDYPYHTLQALDPNTNFSDTAIAQGITSHLMSETRFEVTSVHDVSLRDAWSKVLQGVMEMLPAVESLLLNFTEVRTLSGT